MNIAIPAAEFYADVDLPAGDQQSAAEGPAAPG